jgi:hypothetical protein
MDRKPDTSWEADTRRRRYKLWSLEKADHFIVVCTYPMFNRRSYRITITRLVDGLATYPDIVDVKWQAPSDDAKANIPLAQVYAEDLLTAALDELGGERG